MSISRAELEAMNRDELIEVIKEQSQELDRLDTLIIKSLDRSKKLEATLEDHAERLDDLEAENERLRDRLQDTDGKQDKISAILEFADNKCDPDQGAVYVTPKEIKGACGCSLRYAYDLIDELPEEYNWALTPSQMTDFGHAEFDRSNQSRKVAIDLEGIQSAGVDLNKFNNGSGGDRHE